MYPKRTRGLCLESLENRNLFAGDLLAATAATSNQIGPSGQPDIRPSLGNESAVYSLPRYDVNADQRVSKSDAQAILDALNHQTSQAAAEGLGSDGSAFDVNGDGRLTPLDALLVINVVNQQPPSAVCTNPVMPEDVDRSGEVNAEDADYLFSYLSTQPPNNPFALSHENTPALKRALHCGARTPCHNCCTTGGVVSDLRLTVLGESASSFKPTAMSGVTAAH